MNHQLAIFMEAKKRGLDPNKLTLVQYDMLAVSIRSTQEVVTDSFTAAESLLATTAGIRGVSLEVLQGREAACRSNRCGSFARLADGAEVCHRCSCGGKFLNAKRKDPLQHCPANEWPA